MGTLQSEINDLFLSRISDYRLDTIFTASGSNVFNQYVEPWLLDSIVHFEICNQNLDYTVSGSSTEGVFTENLTLKNKSILSQIMVLYWLEKSVQDILQMNNNLQDRDYKTYAQANNLNAKKDYLNNQREKISQLLVEYAYKNNDWDAWDNQNFRP